MSLVPSLSCSRKIRDLLNNRRNTFTFFANLSILVIAMILFLTIEDPIKDFMILSFIIVSIGFFTSMFFIITIDEVKLTASCF